MRHCCTILEAPIPTSVLPATARTSSWHPTHLFFHAPPDHTQVSLRILPAQLHYAHTGASLPRSVCPPLVTLTLHLYILHAVAPLSFYTHHHYKLAPVMVSSSAGRLRYTCRQQTRTGATAVTLDAVTARIHVSRHAFPANAPREPCPAVTPPFAPREACGPV